VGQINKYAKLVQSLGTLLGILAFFLTLFPGLRLWLLNFTKPNYDVFLGEVWGPKLEHLNRDQFYSNAWANGLKRLDNIFLVEGEVIPNISGDIIPARDLTTHKSLANVAPSSCIFVRELRFVVPSNPPINITSKELRQSRPNQSPAGTLLEMIPANFISDKCRQAQAKAKDCQGVQVIARATIVDCAGP
jgi:hypothetical protein